MPGARQFLDDTGCGHLDKPFPRDDLKLPAFLPRTSRELTDVETSSAPDVLESMRDHDILLTPTLADETVRIGHLDPTADYQQVIDRLVEWVAFTPLQNATGEPAVSLPMAQSANGLPVGMMFAAPLGHERRLLELSYELEAAAPWPRIQD